MNMLVEEMMLLANREVAHFIAGPKGEKSEKNKNKEEKQKE